MGAAGELASTNVKRTLLSELINNLSDIKKNLQNINCGLWEVRENIFGDLRDSEPTDAERPCKPGSAGTIESLIEEIQELQTSIDASLSRLYDI